MTSPATVGRVAPPNGGSLGEGAARTRAGLVRGALLMFVNPGGALKGALSAVPPLAALGVSGTAFGLFFLQTGLDLLRAGTPTLPRFGLTGAVGVIGLCLLGAVYGSLGVAALAALAHGVARAFGWKAGIDSTVRSFALGYCPALVYALLGIVMNVGLGWNTALAFGVTGVLWALGPMVATLREMLGGRTAPAAVLATILGGLVLFGWAFLGT